MALVIGLRTDVEKNSGVENNSGVNFSAGVISQYKITQDAKPRGQQQQQLGEDSKTPQAGVWPLEQ